jgi:hypothetical protein
MSMSDYFRRRMEHDMDLLEYSFIQCMIIVQSVEIYCLHQFDDLKQEVFHINIRKTLKMLKMLKMSTLGKVKTQVV